MSQDIKQVLECTLHGISSFNFKPFDLEIQSKAIPLFTFLCYFLTNGYFLLMNCDIINNFLIFAIILQKETSVMLHKGYRMLFNCLMFYL